jgi:hypothetical protein
MTSPRLLSSADWHVRLFGGPLVVSVVAPSTRRREFCVACNGEACTIGWLLRKACILSEKLDNRSRYGQCRKYVALATSRRIPLHIFMQLQ